MFFSFIRGLVRILIYVLNGKPTYQGTENIPDDNFVLVSPHRSWIDPVFLALATHPKHYCFIAKKELFKNKVFGFLLKKLGAFPVDRDNPGPSAIKTPVKRLKNEDVGFMIFPTGTRFAKDIKGGAVTIAKLSKKPMLPVVYQGAYSFKDLILRKKTIIRIGEPFMVERKVEGVEDINEYYSEKIQDAFDQLDAEIKESTSKK